ncbi:BAD_HP_G0024810.mRNA.1.CDS.1 [Saccharomyces cerevisiae]|nr:BAD_HP_G0024810.mRNA.1.CDS.1 [Saccharomyces cerevisiae]CAI6569005.1 BAD_HP_G0024810.mRNA.1.CDS.1 [Saccharomyces cerevisiae]
MGAENGSRDDEDQEMGANRFTGRGFRLGSTIDAADEVVEDNTSQSQHESYKAPKRKLGGFSGQGQRLGSPIPGESSPAEVPKNETPAAQEQPTSDNEPKQGDTSIQIRYANGKREVLRCNSTDSVKFLYEHVTSNANTDPSRNFTLNYAFPIKPISNDETTLKDADLLNSVVVQRWA